MTHPRLSGLVTEKPSGTLSFWAEDTDLTPLEIFKKSRSTLPLGSYLSVCIVYAVIHQDHDENGYWHAKISNNPTKLKATKMKVVIMTLFAL